MSPVARLQEVRRLATPPVQVEDELVEEARLLSAWLRARQRANRRPTAAHDAAAEQAFVAYRTHLLERLPRRREGERS